MKRVMRFILSLLLLAFATALFAEPLDINSATVEQLDKTLVGVGKVKAEAIVKDREKNGNFKSVDDLVRVKGIGPATLEKNRSKITVGGGTPASTPAPAPSPAEGTKKDEPSVPAESAGTAPKAK